MKVRLSINTYSKKGIIPLFVFVMLIACTPEVLNRESLQEFISDEANGLTKKKSIGEFNISVQYRPTDLLVDQELDNYLDTAEINRLRTKYGSYAYFIVSMDVQGKEALYRASEDQMAFSQNLQNLSYRMNQFVNLTTSAQDTIPVADYVFNRTFGVGGASSMMFVFSKADMEKADWISFNLNEFGMSTGDQRFRFAMEDLNQVPKLKELNN